LLRDERRLPLALLVWGILVAVGQIAMATFHTEPSPTLKLIAHPMTYEFIAGCLIALWMHHRGPILSGTVLTLGIILLAIASVKLTAGLNIEEGWPRVLVFGIPSVLIVYGAVGLEFAGRMTMPKWTEQVGDASYSIYLSHVLILSALGRLWFMTDWHGQVATFVVLMGMFVVVMVVGFASYFCLERPIHEFTRRSVSWSSRPKNTVAASTAK
jgi:exopolysaccharide production protein ExoZ